MSEHPGRLAGKVALITGIGSGQGRAAALLFAAHGAIVLGADLDAENAHQTASMVKAGGGQIVTGPAVDFADEPAVAAWIDETAGPLGGLDILYANAGACRFSPLEQTSAEDWHFTLRNELDVVFFPCKHAWRHLRARGGGSVITVGSTAGVSGSTGNRRVAHTASKGGVVAMTRQLAAEGAPLGIRVNCISPGMVMTPQARQTLLAPDHPMNSVSRHIPLGRIAEPEDIARVALFFASEDSSYVTGANLMVDGGWSAVLPGPDING